MPYALLLGFLLLIGLVALGRADAGRLARLSRRLPLVAAGLLGGLVMAVAGRFVMALATLGATALARHLARQMNTPGGFGAAGGPAGSTGRRSDVATDTLRMSLDHETGAIDGEVRSGAFAGRRLNALGLSDLLTLLAHCRREDPPSAPLLEAYLDRREPDWRSRAGGHGERGRAASAEMDEATARAILGLAPGCTPDDVRAAHRRLMAKLHPDAGGSTFLAAQINRAKDRLLVPRGAG